MSQETKIFKVFIGCSQHQEDQHYKEELKKHLSSMIGSGMIEVWDQSLILGGETKEEEINEHLTSSEIIMLLVSADFFSSDHCFAIMEKALERHHNDHAVIIPVFLRRVQWSNSPLYKLKVVPSDQHPIKSNHWFSLDDAYFKVVDEISKVVNLLRKPASQEQTSGSSDENTVVLDANIKDYKEAIQIKSVHSAGSYSDSGGVQAGTDTVGLENNETIDNFINLTGQSEKLKVADVEFTKAELILKKAILLHKKALKQDDEETQIDLLNTALVNLSHARNLEPNNIEVLLEMAKILIILTPDDPTDEQKLLNQIRNLINQPSNDNEAFCLAQALYLLATSDLTNIDVDLLKEARELFRNLNQKEWVKDCEEMLHHSRKGMYRSINEQMNQAFSSQTETVPSGQMATSFPPPPQVFNPIGNWSVQVRSMIPNTMTLQIFPNGTLTGSQKLVINLPFQGQWGFMNNVLSIQAQMMGQFTSFAIQILHEQDGHFHGRGNDGVNYIFTRI